MAKRFSQILTWCSVALFVVTALLWARSFNVAYRIDRVKFDPIKRDWCETHMGVASGRVSFWLGRQYLSLNDKRGTPGQRWEINRDHYWYARRAGYFAGWTWWYFRWDRSTGPANFGMQGFIQIGFNLAPIVMISGVLPLIQRVRHLRKRRLRNQGRCSRCGYDLRATPQSCPECGMIYPKKPA